METYRPPPSYWKRSSRFEYSGREVAVDDLAPMLMLMTLFITVGGVLLLRPITKHLGEYLRAVTESKRVQPSPDLTRLENVLTSMESRLTHLEERQQFSEALLDSRRPSPAHALAEPVSAADGKRRSAEPELGSDA
jgi:hypothetical protein